MIEKTHFVSKGWGYEHWIVNNDKYCGKLLFFLKNKSCSWHKHLVKEEHFYIHKGKIIVQWSDSSDDITLSNRIVLEEGDVFHVPVGRRHKMTALFDTELFEFSTHHDDEDSIRIQKGD